MSYPSWVSLLLGFWEAEDICRSDYINRETLYRLESEELLSLAERNIHLLLDFSHIIPVAGSLSNRHSTYSPLPESHLRFLPLPWDTNAETGSEDRSTVTPQD